MLVMFSSLQKLPYDPGPHDADELPFVKSFSHGGILFCAPVGTARHAARKTSTTKTHVARIVGPNRLSGRAHSPSGGAREIRPNLKIAYR